MKKTKNKNPDGWKTGTEPITKQQQEEIKKLSENKNEPIETNISRAGADHTIKELSKGK